MSAVDNKHLIEVLAVNVQRGTAKKSGNPYEIHKAQCVIKGPDGVIQIGEMNLPKHLIETKPGKYLAEFELGVNFDRLVVPVITNLHAHGDTARPTAKSAQSA
jgi:hypothetical protein